MGAAIDQQYFHCCAFLVSLFIQIQQAFSAQHHIPLHLCVAASQRRGVVDALTAKDTDKTNLAEGFEITGLGEFMAMALKADRVVTL